MTTKQVGNVLLIITIVVALDILRHYTWGKQQITTAFKPIGMMPYTSVVRRA